MRDDMRPDDLSGPPPSAVAYKFADPTEPERWLFDRGESERIAVEDPNLVVWITEREVD